MENIDRLAIQTLRTLSLEEINAANSGHPGINFRYSTYYVYFVY